MKKFILTILLLLPVLAQASPASKLFLTLIDHVNSLRAHNKLTRIAGYPLSEYPGYYHYKIEDLGQSKESLQKILRAGHRQKDKYNRLHNSIPGYPISEMPQVKLTISDLLGDVYYADEEMITLAKKLGYKDELVDSYGELSDEVWYFFDEKTLDVRSFRKTLEVLEPETSLDIFK